METKYIITINNHFLASLIDQTLRNNAGSLGIIAYKTIWNDTCTIELITTTELLKELREGIGPHDPNTLIHIHKEVVGQKGHTKTALNHTLISSANY
ncbi:MAG: hypothetical protein E6R13_06930 [Spirochaetes bacterium]|nr:MAG: hypothetical protein E6R13_06930 [Spirochaetota bacterium]